MVHKYGELMIQVFKWLKLGKYFSTTIYEEECSLGLCLTNPEEENSLLGQKVYSVFGKFWTSQNFALICAKCITL